MVIMVGMILALCVPVIGVSIFAWILLHRKFKTYKISDMVKFPLTAETEEKYTEELHRIIRKVNGWLYIVVFFTCLNIAVGGWAIIFPLLCFFSASTKELISICSVVAAIASAIMMFLNPQQQAQNSSHAWQDSSSCMSDFNIRLPSFETEAEFCSQLCKLQAEVSDVSKRTKIP